ncbi:hypothetical protein [Halomarina oriensis]|uniref:Uncharacterized protein n=1 Tax=Halomarina oriensis TaxID=671145 RepID=A0A6B0GDX5_9EURY|nr:hypothetical protein [Halomarina oriensis]MWG33136.1 hypothetical protein [Halomarina oriensis]
MSVVRYGVSRFLFFSGAWFIASGLIALFLPSLLEQSYSPWAAAVTLAVGTAAVFSGYHYHLENKAESTDHDDDLPLTAEAVAEKWDQK